MKSHYLVILSTCAILAGKAAAESRTATIDIPLENRSHEWTRTVSTAGYKDIQVVVACNDANSRVGAFSHAVQCQVVLQNNTERTLKACHVNLKYKGGVAAYADSPAPEETVNVSLAYDLAAGEEATLPGGHFLVREGTESSMRARVSGVKTGE